MTAYRLPLPAWRSSILHLQYRQECFLRNLDGSYLLHALLARLLLLQQLALARDVTAVALCQRVLAQRLDRLARDDVRTDRRLYRHVEHLTRDQLPHLGNQLAPPVPRVIAMHDQRQRVHPLAIDQYVEADEVSRPVFEEIVVERGIASGHRFQAVEKVHNDLVQRHLVGQHDLPAEVLHVALVAPLLIAQGYDRADVVLGNEDRGRDDRLADFLDAGGVRQLGRVLHLHHGPIAQRHLVYHRRGGGDEVHAVLALQPFLHDVQMQKPEKAAAETETQRLRGLGLVAQGGVVQVEFFQGIAQGAVLVRVDRIEAGENLGLDFLESGKRLDRRAIGAGERVTHSRRLELLAARGDEADFAGSEPFLQP